MSVNPRSFAAFVRRHISDVDGKLLMRAYVFCIDKHGMQLRDSGAPFFTHPIETAKILAELRMDQDSVIAGLLHDTVEDTETTIDEIEDLFGKSIALMVDGVTKLTQFGYLSKPLSKPMKRLENFKKLLLAASSDIRILVVKLADRLHNMRTLQYHEKDKRNVIARETVEIYAPLAKRIGLISIENELQEIAFKELNSRAYDAINAKIEAACVGAQLIFLNLQGVMERAGIPCSVSYRVKKPYSVWRKMNARGLLSFGQLSDLMAFRIVVESVEQCYLALDVLHRNFRPIPGRLRDYIESPKANGYKSLHTNVMGFLGRRAEVQIRTREMHAEAEHGVAAHWNYKEKGESILADLGMSKWLDGLVQAMESTSNIEKLLGYPGITEAMGEMFCITPKGDIISLRTGATALDFARAINSDVGNRAISACINGVAGMALNTALSNGDRVEIVVGG